MRVSFIMLGVEWLKKQIQDRVSRWNYGQLQTLQILTQPLIFIWTFSRRCFKFWMRNGKIGSRKFVQTWRPKKMTTNRVSSPSKARVVAWKKKSKVTCLNFRTNPKHKSFKANLFILRDLILQHEKLPSLKVSRHERFQLESPSTSSTTSVGSRTLRSALACKFFNLKWT